MTRARRARWGVLVLVAVAGLLPACGGSYLHVPTCDGKDDAALILSAQAVPSATQLPCIAEFPSGWRYSGSLIQRGSVRFWLDSDRAGVRALEVLLERSCDVSNAVEVTAGVGLPGLRVYEEPLSLPPAFRADRYVRFPGGCVTYRFRFASGASSTLALEVVQALSLVPRSALVQRVRADVGLTLCGAGAPPCPG